MRGEEFPLAKKEEKESVGIDDYVVMVAYYFMRHLPNAPQLLGKESFWELRTTQVTVLVELLQKEFNPENK